MSSEIDINEVAEEMSREPLSKALWENAQLRVIVRQQDKRIEQLEQQKGATADGHAVPDLR